MSRSDVVAVVFDFDGTMIDSDDALVAPFLTLGVPMEEISFGHAVAEECERLGIDLDDYVDAYDTDASPPFPGIEKLIGSLSRWAICSNKHPRSAETEMLRLRWEPEVALYADSFDWEHKGLGPILDLMGLAPSQVIMVGDSSGDQRCADEVGCQMVWAGWNPRVAASRPDGLILEEPGELILRFPGVLAGSV